MSIPPRIPASFGELVAIPIRFDSGGESISAVAFSIDFDEQCLALDPTDSDLDGIPDAIVFSIPPQFSASAVFDSEDIECELEVLVFDAIPPLTALVDGTLLTLFLEPTCQPATISLVAHVRFCDDPPASFGSTGGQSIPGTAADGSVDIAQPIFLDGFETGDTSAWSVSSPPFRTRR